MSDPRFQARNLPERMTQADLHAYLLDAIKWPDAYRPAYRQAVSDVTAGFAQSVFKTWGHPPTIKTSLLIAQCLGAWRKFSQDLDFLLAEAEGRG